MANGDARLRHLIIPDCQVKPGHSTEYLGFIGQYILEKQPEKVVCLGDFADMESLSSYDIGKKSFEGKRYVKDIEASHQAMHTLLAPIKEHNAALAKKKKAQYKPEMHMLYGNHENRIVKAVNNDPKLEGVLSLDHLSFENAGWQTHPFLDVLLLDGVAYSHYFVTGVAGRPASTAAAQLRKTNMSSIAGHQQGLQIATATRADGALLTSIICGSAYEHDEDYMGPQGNKHWRGILVAHDVNDGQFDLMPVSLAYLRKKYQ